MNKYKMPIFIIGLLGLLIGIVLISYAQKSMKQDYEKLWAKVDSLQQKSLPKSALEEVDKIYKVATQEQNEAQTIKAIIFQMDLRAQVDEEGIQDFEKMQAELQKASPQVKPMLHSMLAEMYWNYYQQNRWYIQQRSEVENFEQKDITTWNIDKIVREVSHHYQASLENPQELQKIKIDNYNEILRDKGKSYVEKIYRPTLYDFLAHRAVDFFMNQEAEVTKPNYQFTLSDGSYLSNANDFVKLSLTTQDSLSHKYQALVILQGLIRFHLQDENPTALIDIDLKRLNFVYTHGIIDQKEQLYLQTLENIEKTFSKHPASAEATYHIAKVYAARGGKFNPIQSDDFKWDLKKAYEICQKAIDQYPNSKGAQNAKSLQSNILSKNLELTTEEFNIAQKPFKALVKYKNTPEIYVKVVKTSYSEVETLIKNLEKDKEYDYDKRERKYIDFFLKKTVTHEFQQTLPDDKDYQQHSVEIKIPSLEAGEYMILVSPTKDFKFDENRIAYNFVKSTYISYIHRNNAKGGTDFYVLNRQTGLPLQGVKAEIYIEDYNYTKNQYEGIKKYTLESDVEGYFEVPTKLNSKNYNSDNFHVEFYYKNDRFSTAKKYDYNNYYSQRFYQYQTYKNPGYTQIFYFTDRAIYRPGQPIHFKGLVIQTEEGGKNPKIVPNLQTEIALYDVNNQVAVQKAFTTNEYGTFNGTFTAPATGLNGAMNLRSIYGNYYGGTTIRVEDYKRPKFEVKFNPVKGIYKLNETIKATGIAKAYAGANLTDAQVKYRVVREARFPYWWYCWRGYYPTSPSMEILHGEAKTDDKGEFEINFKALPDLSVDKASDPTFTYTVYADVTDLNGETHSSQTYINVGYKALKVGVSIPTSIDQAEKNTKPYTINTTNLNGEFETAQGTIKIFKLKSPDRTFRDRKWQRPDKQLLSQEEFYKTFPEDAYKDEDNALNWAREKEVFSTNYNTDKQKEFSLDKISSWQTGKYVAEITAKDKFGQDVKEVAYFDLLDSQEKNLAYPAVEFYYPLKTTAEPGEKAKILLGSTNVEKVLYEVEQDGKILTKKWLTFKNTQTLLEIPIEEANRGSIAVHYAFIKDNRIYAKTTSIYVPYTNKELDITFETFRNKLLPGEKEEWKLKIKGKKGDQVMAEMVASLYDASLDAFVAHNFNFSIHPYNNNRLAWQSTLNFEISQFKNYDRSWNYSVGGASYYHDYLNWFNYNFYHYSERGYKNQFYRNRRSEGAVLDNVMPSSAPMEISGQSMSKSAPAKKMAVAEDAKELKSKDKVDDREENKRESQAETKQGNGEGEVQIRKNFNETAFFYPTLQTNEKGELIISFTVPEALTRWKMLGFAHTKDLKHGLVQNELVTQKDLMIIPNPPRFFRENDKMNFSAKIANISEQKLAGAAKLQLFDALTMKPIDVELKNKQADQKFTVEKGQNTVVNWSIEIPEGMQAITYRVIAQAGNFSDGEEMALPVLTNRTLVTETLPLPIRGKQSKTFTLSKLLNNTSTTLRNQQLTLEFTSNPAWYAIQALPYMMEYPYECTEQLFSRFYANSLATHIANSQPRIKAVFDTWKNIQPEALLSNLEKNQELKSLLLEETPWVRQAKSESERKRLVGVLFDLNKMSHELETVVSKLVKRQKPNGAWPWFEGLPTDRYITQHIVTGLGHLKALKVKISAKQENDVTNMLNKAINYLDNQIREDYEELKRLEKQGKIKLSDNHLGYYAVQYLYARSFFKENAIQKNNQESFNYYKGQAKKYWLSYDSKYLRGMIALALHRYEDKETPQAILKSLREHAIHNEEMGMYWADKSGYYWYQAPIETQALMIELFDEVAKDEKAVDELKTWLLKQKQTQDWKTTKATAEACYALLLRGENWLASEQLVEIMLGDQIIDPKKMDDVKVEAGTGYFKTSWQKEAIKPEMGKVTITKKDAGVAWGALYWQYFEQLDKITPAETPLKLKKQLFIQKNSDKGPILTPITDKTPIQVGDFVKVRVEIRVDRDMEYVHMKDMRAAGLEPTNVLSQAKYQDGLWYYESTRDAATNFFFHYLPKGTYVFEYKLVASQKGNFSNGITTIQCMYAPEFTSHSEGIRIDIK